MTEISKIVKTYDNYIKVHDALVAFSRDIFISSSQTSVEEFLNTDLGSIVAVGLNKSDKSALSDRARDLITEIESMSKITFFSPVEQPDRFIMEIHQDLGRVCNLAGAFYVKQLVDTSVAGGCVLESAGRYYDYSINKELEEYFNARF